MSDQDAAPAHRAPLVQWDHARRACALEIVQEGVEARKTMRFADGSELEVDFIVFSTGIRPSTIVELVREVVEPIIEAPFELVDIEYGKIGSDMILSIFVDKPEGITLNDTADLTEIISPVLDTIKPDPFPEQYFLEITSPGLERPLKTKDAVAGAVGKYIHVGLYQAIDKQKVFEGTLLAFEEDELTMEYMDKTRKKTVQIPYSLVSKARLAVKL